MENYSVAYFCLITSPRDTHHIPINNRKLWHAFFNLLASILFFLLSFHVDTCQNLCDLKPLPFKKSNLEGKGFEERVLF